MEWFFGKRKTVAELLDDQRQVIRDAKRALEREFSRSQRDEAMAQAKLEQQVAAGRQDLARPLAEGVMQHRSTQVRCVRYQTRLQRVADTLGEVSSQHLIQREIAKANHLMWRINQAMPGARMEATALSFQQNCALMDVKQELIDAAVEPVSEDDEEETGESAVDALLARVEDEVQMNMVAEMSAATASAQRGRKVPRPPAAGKNKDS